MISDWKTISVSRSAIAFENDRSYKLRTCQSCAYPGYELWVSKKLMKPDYTGRYELVKSGKSDAWILKNIGMDAEELLRLKQLSGIAELFKDKDFGHAWE